MPAHDPMEGHQEGHGERACAQNACALEGVSNQYAIRSDERGKQNNRLCFIDISVTSPCADKAKEGWWSKTWRPVSVSACEIGCRYG